MLNTHFLKLIRIIILVSLTISYNAFAEGFRSLEKDGLKIGVWYPSDAPTTNGRLGPFDVNYAFNAPPKNGKYPVVLLSHGNGGQYRNHHSTANALAKNGYIVIAPNHTVDKFIGTGSENSTNAILIRANQLLQALEITQQDSDLKNTIDANTIHAVGYSLGTVTTLVGAGANFDFKGIISHCKENAQDDPEFCRTKGIVKLIKKYITLFVKSFTPSNKSKVNLDGEKRNGFINGSIALVAPISPGITINKNNSNAQKILIVSIKGDKIVPPRFHAKPLFQRIKNIKHNRFIEIPGHHYGFIAPFPKWLTEIEDIPVANDPKGFNRPEFIDSINHEIVKFIKQ